MGVDRLLPAIAKRLGHPRMTDLRKVMNAILYLATTGFQRVQLPKDLPPYSTVQRYFYDWRDSVLLQTTRFRLVMDTRELEGCKASLTADVIDSQSMKTTERGRVCGFDAGKKVKGRKRHFVIDTIGLTVGLVVHAADIQDCDGTSVVLASIRRSCPWLRHIFADRGGYQEPKLRNALELIGDCTVEIVKRSDIAKGFEVVPRRWVVELTFAWLGRCRRLAKDWDKSIASAKTFINTAHIRLATRHFARYFCYS